MAAPKRSPTRSVLTGAVLVAAGGCVGIVAGALLDAPRVLLHRLQGPVQTVELPAESTRVSSDDFEEFRALQDNKPPAAPRARPPEPKPAPALPPVAARRPAVKPASAVVAKPAVKPAPAARAVATPAPSAEALIRDIAARHESPSPPAPASLQPRAVVQVGAFAATPAADKAIARLRAQGFDSYLSKKPAGGRYPHRVRVRPGGGSDANALAAELARRGYDVWITRE